MTQQQKPPRRRLGRGLGSLVGNPVRIDLDDESAAVSAPPPFQPAPDAAAPGGMSVSMIPLDRITPNPRQPRHRFDEHAIETLAQSIRTAGLMQPVIVRRTGTDRFELVAGERRWRAAAQVGLATLPAIVREIDDREAAEWALVENLQREDLNPLERAEAFRRLSRDFGMTHQEIAEAVGMDRSSVSNHLRLLDLDTDTRSALEAGALTMGHARALLAIADMGRRASLAGQAVRGQWSVRELERRCSEPAAQRDDTAVTDAPAPPSAAAAHADDLARRLGEHLGTRVTVRLGRKKGTGRLTIEFFDLEQFDGLMQRLGFSTD